MFSCSETFVRDLKHHLMLWGVSDLEEIRQTRQHVGGDGWDVVDTLTVFQKDPDQQQNRPEGQNHVKFSVFLCDHVFTAVATYPTTANSCPLTSRNSAGFLSFGPAGENTTEASSVRASYRLRFKFSDVFLVFLTN